MNRESQYMYTYIHIYIYTQSPWIVEICVHTYVYIKAEQNLQVVLARAPSRLIDNMTLIFITSAREPEPPRLASRRHVIFKQGLCSGLCSHHIYGSWLFKGDRCIYIYIYIHIYSATWTALPPDPTENPSWLGPQRIPGGRYCASRLLRVDLDLDRTSNRFVHTYKRQFSTILCLILCSSAARTQPPSPELYFWTSWVHILYIAFCVLLFWPISCTFVMFLFLVGVHVLDISCFFDFIATCSTH